MKKDRSASPVGTETHPGYPVPPGVRRVWLPVGCALLLTALLVATLLAAFGASSMTSDAPPMLRIAFSSNREGSFQIYTASVMNLSTNNRGATPAAIGRGVGGDGTWEADGGNALGTQMGGTASPPALISITRLTSEQGAALYPVWSPDGRKLAYSSDREGHPNIYVMNADGSGKTALTHDSQGNARPVWSPDGTRIAFKSDRLGDWDIWVMNVDGTEQSRLTTVASEEDNPTWSPDSQYIAFNSWYTGNTQIYVMKADGTDKARLTNNYADDWAPAWSPDGQRIAFASNRDGRTRIYIMNRDGSGQVALSTGDLYGADEDPAWSRTGNTYSLSPRTRPSNPVAPDCSSCLRPGLWK